VPAGITGGHRAFAQASTRHSRTGRDLPHPSVEVWHYDSVSSGQNAIQGDFGEAWLEVVASGCGLLRGRSTLDLEKADLELTYPGQLGDSYCPTVKVQVKTQVNLKTDANGNLVYNLDVQTYDSLRRDDHTVRRVLVVIGLLADGPRVKLHEDGTLLIGRGAWVSLEGCSPTANTATQVVRLPPENTLNGNGLHRMLATYGIRRSFPVPNADPWTETKEREGEQ
jgi:hypothetical protein